MRTAFSIATLVIAWSTFSCSTNPQPIPLPLVPPDTRSVYLSSPERSDAIFATGVPGAVEYHEGIQIVVRSIQGQEERRGPVFEDGSFTLGLRYAQGERFEAWVERGTEQSARATLPEVKAKLPTDAVIIIRSISRVVAGQTTVSGSYTAGDLIIVGNPLSGASTAVTSNGEFTASVAAQAGDRLEIFAFDPVKREASGAVEVTVPGS
jgi:hypothetical protein